MHMEVWLVVRGLSRRTSRAGLIHRLRLRRRRSGTCLVGVERSGSVNEVVERRIDGKFERCIDEVVEKRINDALA